MNLTRNFCDGKLSIRISISEASTIGILKPPSDWLGQRSTYLGEFGHRARLKKKVFVGWVIFRKNVVVPVIDVVIPDILVILCYTLQY